MSAPPDLSPDDEHNRRLRELTHPAGWSPPDPHPRYDLVVIGGGTAGLVASIGAARLGARVALVEKHFLGGDCLVTGCVPSKALLHAARRCYQAKQAPARGVMTEPEVHFEAVMERLRRVRADIAPHDAALRVASDGVHVYFGQAQFASPRSVAVDGSELRFRRAIIATGARPFVPDIPGLTEAGYLTSETVFSLTSLPRRLAVVGGGPIGCELAQAFARLGSQVTLLQRAERLLPRDDPEASEMLQRQFEEEGIQLVLRSEPQRVELDANQKKLFLVREGQSETLTVDEILLATGRRPNVAGLGLQAAEVEADPERGVLVDDLLRTSNRRVFAAGDVCSSLQFTHAANALARVALQNALFFGRKKASALTIPWCTYTDPEVAHVGLPWQEAREFDSIRVEVGDNDRAIIEGSERGFLRARYRGWTGQVQSATMVGPHAGNVISEIGTAMQAKLGILRWSGNVRPYPTESELLLLMSDLYADRRFSWLRPWFERYFALFR